MNGGWELNGRWFDDEDRILSEINITPLVDVALVLLIIFMITAPMMVQGADVRLPETRPMDSLPADGLYITVDAAGTIYVNRTAVDIEDLEARLSTMATPGRTAYLRADRTLQYGLVMRVLGHMRRAGLVNLGMVTEPIPEDR